jgi:hypothetical protein
MSVTPKLEPGRAAETAVAIIASETATTSAATHKFPINDALLEEDLRRRAETVTAVLEKILEQPPPSQHWGINE